MLIQSNHTNANAYQMLRIYWRPLAQRGLLNVLFYVRVANRVVWSIHMIAIAISILLAISIQIGIASCDTYPIDLLWVPDRDCALDRDLFIDRDWMVVFLIKWSRSRSWSWSRAWSQSLSRSWLCGAANTYLIAISWCGTHIHAHDRILDHDIHCKIARSLDHKTNFFFYICTLLYFLSGISIIGKNGFKNCVQLSIRSVVNDKNKSYWLRSDFCRMVLIG